jgi:hypothetical protein
MAVDAVRPSQVWSHPQGDFGPWFVVAVSKMAGTGQEVVTYRMTNDSSAFWTRPLDNWRELGLVRRR